MSGQTISTSETRIEAVKLQSSAYAATIPLVFGVTKISGNLVWYGGFKAIPHTTEQGGKGGGVKVQNTTYSYRASVMMALAHGRIIGIPLIWRGKKLFTGGVTPAQVQTATETYTPPGSGAMTYTVAQAATYVSTIYVRAPVSVGGSWNRTLRRGFDYSVKDGVVTIHQDQWRGVALSIRYQYTTGTVSYSALDELGLTLLTGEVAQAMWSGLSSFPADQRLGYSGLAVVAGLDYELGTGAQVENHQFEVVAPMAYHLGATVPDVDPAPMLHEVLTNTRGGASFNAAALDDWSAWSDFCVASGLLVSPAITEQQPAADVLRMAAQLTVTGPVWSGGRLKMVPYADTAVTGNGRTFTPNTTPVYDLDDDCFLVSSPGEAPLRARLKSQADRYNHVRVEYLNRGNQYNPDIAEATDLADIEERGRRTMPTVRARWICEHATARLVAQLLMQRSLYVCSEYEATLPWHYALLEPMDLVTLTDVRLEMNDFPARITVIEEDEDGELRCEFEDYPAGQASAALYPSSGGSGFAHDYNVAPGNADAPVIFEAPVDRTLTGLALYVAVKGASANWGGAQIWVSQDGTNYKQMGVVYGRARFGTVTTNVAGGVSTIDVQGLGAEQLVSGSAADAAALNTLCYVGGANPEYFAYETATLTGAGAYTLGALVHGAFDTGAPAHSSGDVFVRVDERVVKSEDLDISMVGKTLYFKLCSFNVYGGGQQGLADVSATTYTVTGAQLKARAALTYVATAGMVVAGNSVLRFSGSATTWTQSIYSRTGLKGGAFVSASGAPGHWRMFGLSTAPAGTSSYTGIDYAIYLSGDSGMLIFEGGANISSHGTYDRTDVFAVAYDGADVIYTKNGVELRRVAVALGLTLYLDTSFLDDGGRLDELKFLPLSQVSGITTPAVARAGYAEASLSGGAPGDVTVTMCSLAHVNNTARPVQVQVDVSFYDAYLTNDPAITVKELFLDQTGATEGNEVSLVERFGVPPSTGNYPGFTRSWQYTVAVGATLTCAFKVRVAGSSVSCKVSCDQPIVRILPLNR